MTERRFAVAYTMWISAIFLNLEVTRSVFFIWRCCPMGAIASSFMRFLDHTQRRRAVGRTPLDE